MGEPLEARARRVVDVALRALAQVLELGHGAQVLVPMGLGPLLGLGQLLLKLLEPRELSGGLRKH